MRPLIRLFLCFLVCSELVAANAAPPGSSGPDIRKLLRKWEYPSADSALGKLFSIGDERMDQLIAALDDPEQEISLNAQRVIRLLGNPRGVSAVHACDGRGKKTCLISGAVPIPLDEWDFKFLEASLSRWSSSFEREYLIAATLDSSPRALQYRNRILEKLGKEAPDLPFENLRELPKSGRTPEGAVEKDLCFVWKDARKFTTTKFLAFNGAKDRALVEVYVNQGALMEEWYLVVLQKRDGGWKYFSITMVRQS